MLCDTCDTLDFTRITPAAPLTTEPLSSLETVDCGGDSAVRLEGLLGAEETWEDKLPLRLWSTRFVEESAGTVVIAR